MIFFNFSNNRLFQYGRSGISDVVAPPKPSKKRRCYSFTAQRQETVLHQLSALSILVQASSQQFLKN